MIRRIITEEGETHYDIQSMKVMPDSTSENCLFLVWPLDVVHVIDKDSPLYDLNASDFSKERFELLLVMEGTSETSNMTFQAKYIYFSTSS